MPMAYFPEGEPNGCRIRNTRCPSCSLGPRSGYLECRHVKKLAKELGINADTVDGAIAIPDCVTAETDAAIAAGVFGSPFYAVGDELFWGQEKIEDVISLAVEQGSQA